MSKCTCTASHLLATSADTGVHVRLTVGSAAGSIRDLFAKIKAIDAKHGKFDLVLCTGDFFGPPKDEDEKYGEDDEIVQLLNEVLQGACRYSRTLTRSCLCVHSTPGVLHHAGRTSLAHACH